MRMLPAMCVVLVLACVALSQTRPPIARATTRPTTGPAAMLSSTQPTTKPAELTPEAEHLLERLAHWHDHADGVSMKGTLVGEFDVAGRSRRFEMQVIGYADGKGRFSHEAVGVGRVVQTGEQVYIFDQRRNSYAMLTSPAARPDPRRVPEAVFEILIDENPMLLPLLTDEPERILVRGAKKASVKDGELVIESDTEVRSVRLDPDGRIVSVRIDYSPLLKSRGAEAVKQASATLTYDSFEPRLPEGAEFAFKPPAASTEMMLPSELMKERLKELQRRIPTRGPTTSPSPPAPRPTTRPATSD